MRGQKPLFLLIPYPEKYKQVLLYEPKREARFQEVGKFRRFRDYYICKPDLFHKKYQPHKRSVKK